MTPSDNLYKLLTHFEGTKLEAYQDSVGVWTIGIGSTRYLDGSKVKKGDKITLDQADELMRAVVKKFAQSVDQLVKIQIPQHQFDALVSLCYNIGIGNFEKSTLLRMLNKQQDASDQFLVWNKAGGKELAGLTRRRKSEQWLFRHGELKYDF